jgi:U3 small nucleolar RNA-associated protein 20
VEEIDIDVYRSLHTLKAEPSSGSSFFLDAIVEWRVCDLFFSCFVYSNL